MMGVRIAIEGPIGAGKTTLAHRISRTFGLPLLLERAQDNPFLPRFYAEPSRFALTTELFFLFQRSRQLGSLPSQGPWVTDFLWEKNRLFAGLTLATDELPLYDQAADHLSFTPPPPQLVVFLRARPPILAERIRKRGIAFEAGITLEYLERLCAAYEALAKHLPYPILGVDTEGLDLASSKADYRQVTGAILDLLPHASTARTNDVHQRA